MKSPDFTALMALFDSEIREEVFLLLDLAKIKNYTHFTQLNGSSEYGKKENTVSWPGSNEILMLIVNASQYDNFKEAVQKYKKERTPQAPLLLLSWDLKELM